MQSFLFVNLISNHLFYGQYDKKRPNLAFYNTNLSGKGYDLDSKLKTEQNKTKNIISTHIGIGKSSQIDLYVLAYM